MDMAINGAIDAAGLFAGNAKPARGEQAAAVLGRCALLDAIGVAVSARLREQAGLRARRLYLEGRTIAADGGDCVCLDGRSGAGTTHVGQNRIVLDDAERSALDFELSAWAGCEADLVRRGAEPLDGHDVTVLAIHDVASPLAGPAASQASTGFLTILGGTGRFAGANGIARFTATYELCDLQHAEGVRLRTAFTLDWVHWRRLPATAATAA